MRHPFRPLLVAALLCASAVVQAAPILSVDLDPLAAGVQSTRSVALGSRFTVDLVVSDDGNPVSPSVFDALVLQALFNDAGPVLGLVGAPLAGALAANSAVTRDAFSFAVVSPGATLTQQPAAVPGPFADGTGAIGMQEFPVLGGTNFQVAPSDGLVSVVSLELEALALGTSTILPAPFPAGAPVFALLAQPVASSEVGGVVRVVAAVTPVPEPLTAMLVLAGVAGVGVRRASRRVGGR